MDEQQQQLLLQLPSFNDNVGIVWDCGECLGTKLNDPERCDVFVDYLMGIWWGIPLPQKNAGDEADFKKISEVTPGKHQDVPTVESTQCLNPWQQNVQPLCL